MKSNAQSTLAAWCSALEWSSIPEMQRALVPLRVLDTLGLIATGAATEAVRSTLKLALDEGGRGAASLFIATERLPAARCALVHGVAAHCRDFDDTFPDSVVHPGSVVVPAALAAGEGCAALPEDIGAAIAVGYEIAARIGAVAGRRFHARGLHATGIVGPIAAAAAAARACRLSAQHLASAMGLAASMSSGLMAFQADGAWSKWLHVGWAAQGGILAADLAAREFRAPMLAIDGPFGLYAALLAGESVETAALTRGLGTEWKGGGALFKYYPCAHVIQPYIDAALTLRSKHGLSAADVDEVRCAIAPWAVPIVCEPRASRIAPVTDLDAIASLPYLVAHALAEGEVGLAALAPTARERADIRALAARIVHDPDPTLGQGFDARIVIRTGAGSTFAAMAEAAACEPAKLQAKFVANATPLLGAVHAKAAAAQLVSMVAPDPAAIAALFRAT